MKPYLKIISYLAVLVVMMNSHPSIAEGESWRERMHNRWQQRLTKKQKQRALKREPVTERFLSSYEAPGPHRTTVLDFPNLKDSTRNNRAVPLTVHAPAEGTNFPLIIMSHGGGGTREAHAYQAEHLASHGYVVICTEHIFSNNVRVKQLMASRDKKMTFKEAIHAVTKDPRAMLGRPRDVSYAIDQAIGWNRTHRLLQRKINTKKIAVMGHSFGAYTTLVACGARPILDHMDPPVTPGKGLAEDVSDNRIAFGFAMSPQSPGTTYFGKESYKTINRPLVCLTGSKDIQKSFKGKKMSPKKRLEVFNLLPVGRKYFLWLKNADHFAFTDNPKAYLFPSEARSDTQRISKVLMVIFSDMFLKEKQDMSMPILKQYIQSLCGDVVTEIKWMEK